MAISFHNDGITFHLKEKNRHKNWIRNVVQTHQKIPGNLTFIFTSNEHLRLMNREYLNHDYFTDVITFDYTDKDLIAGDIFISVDQVNINAGEYESMPDEELRRVMIHGVMHLLGYGDSNKKEQEEMRNLEREALILW
ncbi:MAG: rRNA maturation RNase YbeY [Anaerolineales bacterium]